MLRPVTGHTNDLQPIHPLEPDGRVQPHLAELAELAARAGDPDQLMIDATHLKAHRTAASLLKKGLYPDVSAAAEAA
jgi:hypothetical protein